MRTLTISVASVGFVVCTASCEALTPRVAPIQNARVVVSESFVQSFRVANVVQAERVFVRVLGERNYDALTAEEWAPHMQQLVSGDVEAFGSSTLVVSLYPADLDSFFIEGWGRFSAVDRKTGQVLASGGFALVDDGPRPIEDFERGSLKVRARQTLKREFALEKPNFAHESVIGINLHIEQLDEDLYIVDYAVGHEVAIVGDAGRFEVLGCIRFSHHDDGRKVIDLRGSSLIRDDYESKMRSAGYTPKKGGVPDDWVELRACKKGEIAPDCACGPAR